MTSMSEFVEVHWTADNLDEIRKVARLLVEEGLVACAQIIPWIESCYKWNGKIETTQESKAVFKTKRQNFEAVRDKILELATYEVPEILLMPILDGNPAYFEWIAKS